MKIQTHIENLDHYKQYLQVEQAVHQYLQSKRYLKIDLPVLSPALIPESYLEVFETEFRFFENRQKLYLTPSPELFLKRLLVYEVNDCYYLGKSFRNSEPHSSLHSFEFTMLEFYKKNANYLDIAEELLKLLQYICLTINKKNELTYQGQKISFTQWEKLTVTQAFEKYTGIKEEELFDHQLLLKKATTKGYTTDGFSYEDIFSQIYTQEVESHLGKNGYPTLLYDYPKEFAALAKLNSDGKTAQRFEFYIEGVELGDCYTELTDWKEQQDRFNAENQKRNESGKIDHPIDKGFIEALKYGLANCAGIALGFERLAMIFADVTSINQLKLISIQ